MLSFLEQLAEVQSCRLAYEADMSTFAEDCSSFIVLNLVLCRVKDPCYHLFQKADTRAVYEESHFASYFKNTLFHFTILLLLIKH